MVVSSFLRLLFLSFRRVLALGLLFFLAVPPVLHAQSISTAQLAGSVKDPSGAALSGATVTAADPTKGFSRSAKTDAQGNYQILQLPPGTYSVTFDAASFSPLIQNNVVLTVGEQAERSGDAEAWRSEGDGGRQCECGDDRDAEQLAGDDSRSASYYEPADERSELYQLHVDELADCTGCGAFGGSDSDLGAELWRCAGAVELNQRGRRGCRRLCVGRHAGRQCPRMRCRSFRSSRTASRRSMGGLREAW